MKTQTLGLILLTGLSAYLSSCGKAVDVEGTVYSKRKIPVPNVEVQLERYTGSDYSERSVELVKTDALGRFMIHKRFKKNRGYKVFCHCDSGSYRSGYLTRSSSQNVDLFLE